MAVQDKIIALCSEMHAAGEVVSYEAIRSRRGGGSKRDISEALKVWREQNPGIHNEKSLRSYRKDELCALVQSLRDQIREKDEIIREQREEIVILANQVRKWRGYYPEDYEDYKHDVWDDA